MEIEQLAIRDFLSQCAPLNLLNDETIDKLCMSIEIRYIRTGNSVMKRGGTNNEVLLIRSGAIEVYTEGEKLYGRFGEGEWVGHRTVLRDGTVTMDVNTIEDTLFYCFPAELFRELLTKSEEVERYFTERKPDRVRQGIKDIYNPEKYRLLTTRLSELARQVLQVTGDISIREVATRMTQTGDNSVLVIEDDMLVGIVTDEDFRKRVVAIDGRVDDPVSSIMTANPYRLTSTESASEALLLMARRNIRHVPVVDEVSGGFAGMVNSADLLRSQSNNPIYLVGDIHQASDVNALQVLSKTLPQALVGMVGSNLPAYDIGHAVSSIGQAITRKLLNMAEGKLGPPPVPYCFVTAGSMGRREQTAHSDQDTAMILSDDYDEAKHDEYFLALSKIVSDGMDACGYVYCPGDIMSTNKEWRQPISVWRKYFSTWVDTPKPQALLNASVFFDMRWLHGEKELLDSLQAEVLEKTKRSSLFQAHMASNALQHQPPLGIFKGFVLEKNGDGGKALDMKLRGVVPVIDLARVRALAVGASPLNTMERLDAISQEGGMTESAVADLRDAFEFISTLRLHHQAAQIEAGNAPDNFLDPKEISALERRYLKDAFEVVTDLQNSLSRNYRLNLF